MDNNMYRNNESERPLSLGEWIITLIVSALPCVGIIMMFVWGFGHGNINRRNYCRAALILTAAGIVLGAIFYGSLAAVIMNVINNSEYAY